MIRKKLKNIWPVFVCSLLLGIFSQDPCGISRQPITASAAEKPSVAKSMVVAIGQTRK